MSKQEVYLCRHGETEWSLSGQHTSVTDLPLTEKGRRQAEALKQALEGKTFAKVFVSPLLRAKKTCEIAGYMDEALVDEDLFEWRYGDYEGRRTDDIRKEVPDWSIFTHGAPNGESVEEITVRADRMIEKVRAVEGPVALFSSGHISRVLAVRWLGYPTLYGRNFTLSTATLSILGYERENPAVRLWNSR